MSKQTNDNKDGKYQNQLDADPVDFGFTRAEIMKSRGYSIKKKKAKKNDK